MTTYSLKKPQAIFYKTTSSLLKFANCSTPGGEIWCAHRFHDDHNNKKPQEPFLLLLPHSSNSLTVPRMEMKLGTHACNIISMTTTLFEQQIGSGNCQLLLHFSNSLKVPCIEMKLGMHACYIISMTTACFHDDHMLLASGTLHSSNLLTVALMEIKLGTNAYDIVAMTTTLFEQKKIASVIYFFTPQTC